MLIILLLIILLIILFFFKLCPVIHMDYLPEKVREAIIERDKYKNIFLKNYIKYENK